MKDSKSLIMQIKCLTNSLPTLSELKKRKPNLYKNDHCILCKKELPEDFDHLMRCSALQDSQKEIEEAVIKGVIGFRTEENNDLDFSRKIEEIVFLKDDESRYQRRKDLVIGLEEKKMAENLWLLAQEKSMMRIWIDSIFFITQRSFAEIIWNWQCEKVILWEKKEGIMTKLKRNKVKKKESKVKTQTNREKKVLLAGKKKERGQKKEQIVALIEEVVKKDIKEGDVSLWSFF